MKTVESVESVESGESGETVKTVESGETVATGKLFASTSVVRHLLCGVVGFGLITGSIALVPSAGPAALLAAPLGLAALRGCPACWMIGLAQTVSRRRLERTCVDGACILTKAGGRPSPNIPPPDRP